MWDEHKIDVTETIDFVTLHRQGVVINRVSRVFFYLSEVTDEVLLQYECSTDMDIDRRRMIVVVSGG